MPRKIVIGVTMNETKTKVRHGVLLALVVTRSVVHFTANLDVVRRFDAVFVYATDCQSEACLPTRRRLPNAMSSFAPI